MKQKFNKEQWMLKMKELKATDPALWIAGLLLFLLVIACIGVVTSKNDLMRTVEAASVEEKENRMSEMNQIMDYLGMLDETMLYNQEALDTVADYPTLYENKSEQIKNTNLKLQKLIENYLNHPEGVDTKTEELLKGILAGLQGINQEIHISDETFVGLLEEYKTAEESRRLEIEKELEVLFQSLSEKKNQLESYFLKLEKYMEGMSASEKETDVYQQLKNIYQSLERYLQEDLTSFMELLESTSLNMALKLEEGISNLKEEMTFLQKSIHKTQNDISNLYTTVENNDSTSSETISREFEQVKTSIFQLNEEFQSVHEQLQETLKELQKDMEKLFKEQEKQQKKLFQEQGKSQKELFEEQNNYLDETFTEQTTRFEEVYLELQGILEEMSVEMETLITEQFTFLFDTLTQMEETYLSTMEDYHQETTTNLQNMNTDISNQFDGMGSDISNHFNTMDQNISNQFTGIGTEITNKFEGMGSDITNKFERMDTNISERLEVINQNNSSHYENLTNMVNLGDDGLKTYLESMYGDLKEKLNQVFQFVSNGKKLLASALLTKGVNCEEDATFTEIYESILAIKQTLVIGVEQLPGTIAYDYHYHVDGEGNMPHIDSVEVGQLGGCYTTPIYHSHSGSSDSGGGCYSVAHTGYRQVGCGGGDAVNGPHGPDSSGQYYWVGNCTTCGGRVANYGGPGWASCGDTTTVSYTYYSLGCGLSNSTIMGYRPSCGLADGQIVGAHIVYEPAYASGYNGAEVSTMSLRALPVRIAPEPEAHVPQFTSPPVEEKQEILVEETVINETDSGKNSVEAAEEMPISNEKESTKDEMTEPITEEILPKIEEKEPDQSGPEIENQEEEEVLLTETLQEDTQQEEGRN